MYASVEYMLAGPPVVSTPSIGGRDVFFDPDHCLVVPSDARAIGAAVQALVARDVPREVVRARTLQRVETHRAAFVELMNALPARHGAGDFAAAWPALHRHRWTDWVDLDEFWRDVERRRAAAAPG